MNNKNHLLLCNPLFDLTYIELLGRHYCDVVFPYPNSDTFVIIICHGVVSQIKTCMFLPKRKLLQL